MFLPRQVIYFSEFYFQNGNTAKPKYLIVLSVKGDDVLVASLPTRRVTSPNLVEGVKHGCVNIDERMFNCYAFSPDKEVCTNGFKFPLNCFIYGQQVLDYEISILKDLYKIEGVDYFIEGILTEREYNNILECLRNSNSVKRKIIRLIS